MCCLDLKWIFSDFSPNLFKLFVKPLEGTLKIELFSKDVGLNLLHVGIFTSFLSCLVYSVCHPVDPILYMIFKHFQNGCQEDTRYYIFAFILAVMAKIETKCTFLGSRKPL